MTFAVAGVMWGSRRATWVLNNGMAWTIRLLYRPPPSLFLSLSRIHFIFQETRLRLTTYLDMLKLIFHRLKAFKKKNEFLPVFRGEWQNRIAFVKCVPNAKFPDHWMKNMSSKLSAHSNSAMAQKFTVWLWFVKNHVLDFLVIMRTLSRIGVNVQLPYSPCN
jgi:hypothetical protein